MRKLAIALVLVAGCSHSEDSQLESLIDPGPPPQNGLQLILPIHKDIQPGTSNELCTWTDYIADTDLHIKAVQAFQSLTGHHVVVYKTKTHQAPGTSRPCNNDDLTELRFVSGAGGEGNAAKTYAPGDLAFTIEKGYQIVVNEHFLNASPIARDVQSAVNLEYADIAQKFTPIGAMVVTDTNLHLAPGAPAIDISCTLEQDFKVWFAIPHMHAWGVDITVDHVPAIGAPRRLFDTTWSPELTFHPPEMRADPATPWLLNKGDQVNVHCLWRNDTDKPLTFGTEMCVFFSETVDDTGLGNQACNGGQWSDF